MRHLILMRGAQGAGKSTFITQHGLDGFTLSPDTLRLQMGGIIMLPEGRMTISAQHDRKVWLEMERLLEQKMARGELIVFDATFQNSRDFKMPMGLAHRYGYTVWCVDFTDVPADLAKTRNRMRPEWKQVPDEVIDRAYERFAASRIPDGVVIVRPEAFDMKVLEPRMQDLNAYRKVHHIGDIQGCYAPLADYFRDGLRDDEFYIFVGDFLDRGVENGQVIRFVVDELLPRDNVALIYGNHEYHIQRYAQGLPPVSGEFEHKTLPQLLEANFTRGEAHHLVVRLQDVMTYVYGPHKMLVSHAGIARVPGSFAVMPSMQLWKGTGAYVDPVDEVFSTNMAGTDWIQVHGHRNSARLPMRAGERSFNLESEVEFGGDLSVVTLDRNGVFEEVRVVNTVFAASQGHRDVAEGSRLSEAGLADLRKHADVQEKRFASYPHISSFNFTRTAFSKGRWDGTSLSARGLFVDDARHIVARAYDKFFNLEERPETQMRNLQAKLVFPLTLYVKENGFLGLLGYDRQTDALFFASKSTPESEFAGWFREILTAKLGVDRLETLKARLRDDNLSLVFEVNDPARDPHMIEYAEPHVVLLDAVTRTQTFGRLDYSALVSLAADLGLAVKQQGMVFTDWSGFADWYASVESAGMDYRFNDQHVEGFVIEDATNFMFKIKLPYYSFWKAMRSIKERILSARQTGGDARCDNLLNMTGEAGRAFMGWARIQGDDVLSKDIITIRKRYLTEMGGAD